MSEEMYEPYVTISWCPVDIKEIRPGWSDERCKAALDWIAVRLEEQSIEKGWEILENLLDYHYSEE